MALQGTLRDFAITDIFQLLGQQGKTGTLSVVQTSADVQVIFDRGSVVLARFTKGYPELRLGNMIYNSGVITKEQLENAMQEHQKVLKSVGDVLLGRKYIDQLTLSEFIGLQTRETLFLLLQWKNGAYKFVTSDFNYNRRIIKPISTDFLLMDGVRQLDEWPAILNEIPSFEAIFGQTSAGEEALKEVKAFRANAAASEDDDLDAAFAEFDAGASKKPKAKKPEIDEAETLVLGIVNGSFTVQEVIDRSRLGRFEACRAIVALDKRGCIQATGKVSRKARQRKRPNFAPSAHILRRAVSYCIVLGAIAGALLFARPHTSSQSFQTMQLEIFGNQIEGSRFQALANAVRLYSLEAGEYPPSLNDLHKRGLLAERTVEKYLKSGYTYDKTFQSFTLVPPPQLVRAR